MSRTDRTDPAIPAITRSTSTGGTVLTRFGENLREAREAARLTQAQLAERLGYQRATSISIWETGRKFPEPDTIVRIAEVLQCPPAQLLLGVETPYDALRGPDAEAPIRLRSEDVLMYRAWLQLPRSTQLRHAALIVQTAAALREFAAIQHAARKHPSTASTPAVAASPAEHARTRRSR